MSKKPTMPKQELIAQTALGICSGLRALGSEERARALALFVGMQEVKPGLFRADLSILNKDQVVAVAVLAHLVPTDVNGEDGVIVYCFPGLPPR